MKRFWTARNCERKTHGKSQWYTAAKCVRREMIELPREARRIIDSILDGEDLGIRVRGIRLR